MTALPSGRRDSGITLIELMIVVIVVGLLALIAVNSYRGYTQRLHRIEATTGLVTLKRAQEDFRLVNHTYTSDLDALGFPGGCTEYCVYTIEFTVAPDTRTFTARARPTAGGGSNGVDQTGDTQCEWFSLDAQGLTDAGPETGCWAR